MNDKLTKTNTNNEALDFSKAKQAIAKATSLEELSKIRNFFKAATAILKDTMAVRERVLDAQEVWLMAEHKAGKMLNVCKAERAGGVSPITDICVNANINPKVAWHWQTIADNENFTEESLAKYAAWVREQDDPNIEITLQGFRKFGLGKNCQSVKSEKHDYAVLWIKGLTKKAAENATEESMAGATESQKNALKIGLAGILDKGYITRGR